jgi:hypothetical protein
MMTRKIRALVIMLAICLLSIIPAFAEPTGTGTTPTEVDTFEQLQNELNKKGNLDLKFEGTGVRVKDSITILSGSNVTLDLNGNKLVESLNGPTILVQRGATLTLTNTASKESVVENTMDGQPAVLNNGTTTIEGNVKLQDTRNDQYYVLVNHGDMTINDPVTVYIGNSEKGNSEKSVLIENGYYSYKDSSNPNNGYVDGVNQANPKLTINGGTFDGGRSNVKNDDGGVVTINGGTFKNAMNAILNWNKMTINGGDFTAKYNLIKNLRDDSNKSDSGELDDSNKSDSGELLDQGDLTINGGTFTATLVIKNNGEILGVYPVFGCNESDDTEKTKYTAAKTTITGGTFTNRLDGNVALNFTITGGTFAVMPSSKSIPSGYSIKKDSYGYTIEPIKLTNEWTEKLHIEGWTFGKKANEPKAKAKYGTPTYKYYDKNKKALSKKPTLPGTYYVKASVAATAEVKGVESDYVKFYIYQPAFVLTAKTKRTADKLSWTKVSGADTYKVYYGSCSRPLKFCKTVKGTSLTKKGLKKYRNYKFIVKAYKTVKGKRVFIAKTNSAHVIGAGYSKRFTEARSVSVTESTMDLTVNGHDTVDAQQAKLKKGRRFLGGSHAALFRFMSSDKAVAQVNSKGEVTGVSAGTCTVYVIAQNGRYKTVTVTVK